MRLSIFSLASGLCFVSLSGFAAPASDVLARLPLRFEAADGQKDSQKWIARGPGFGVAFTQEGSFMQLGDRGLRLTLPGADRHAKLEGVDKSATPTNYFGKPFRSADAYGRLRQAGIYPGINIVYYGQGQSLEYDFELAGGADPSQIRMRFEGADSMRLGPKGEIVLTIGDRQVTQNPPVVYQRRTAWETVGVPSAYVMKEDGSIGMTLGDYDVNKPLVIDPTVLYTAYLAGSSADVPIGIGHDKNGSIYIAGYTYSPDFVQVGQPYTSFFLSTAKQVFTTVMNPLGPQDTVVTYSGFFSGSFGDDLKAMTVSNDGVFYLAGVTDDFNFPVTPTGYLTANGGVRRSFVSVLDPKIPGTDGLVYSTFFAGTKTDEPTGIAFAAGRIYVTGFTSSDDYPVTANAYQSTRPGGTYDGWVAEFDPSQSGTASLISSTYLGGTGQDVPRSIAVAADGQAWVAGYTRSGDFPTTSNSYRPFYSGGGDAFLTRLDLGANAVTYSTYLGGSGQDQATKILAEPSGNVGVTGFTLSSNFPVTSSALQSSQAGNGDAFLTIVNPSAPDFTTALVYSTYLGGSDSDVAYDIRRDTAGKYYLCGYTLSLDFPTQNALNPTSVPGNSIDGFVSVIDPAAAPLKSLIYSSHITGPGYQIAYGVDVDAQGNIYVTGTALGDVFGGMGAKSPDNSNLNVFLLVFQP